MSSFYNDVISRHSVFASFLHSLCEDEPFQFSWIFFVLNTPKTAENAQLSCVLLEIYSYFLKIVDGNCLDNSATCAWLFSWQTFLFQGRIPTSSSRAVKMTEHWRASALCQKQKKQLLVLSMWIEKEKRNAPIKVICQKAAECDKHVSYQIY